MQDALIFDLDGTLVDSLRGIADSLHRALHEAGLPGHPDAAVRRFIGDGARMLVTRAAPTGTSETSIDRLEAAFKRDYDRTWPDSTVPYEGVAALLAELQDSGIPLAVLSNKPHPFTCGIVKTLFPAIRFSSVIGHRPGLPLKPDPAGALEVASEIGIEPARCTLIGDSTMDLDTGHRAGMRTIGVTWGYQDRERLAERSPDRVVDDVSGLRHVLF